MKILTSLRSGCSLSLKSWKGVLIIWFSFLILIAVLAVPLRSSVKSSLGNSMITEKLVKGFDIEAFADMGTGLKSLTSFASSGFIFLFLAGFILNAFMSGGLFSSLKKENGRFSSAGFFSAGAENFWSFLIIMVIVSFAVLFVSGILILIPSIISSASESLSEKSVFMIYIAAFVVLMIIKPVFILIADYSRAWKVSNVNGSGFRAIGFGFSQTFRTFGSSYLTMLILLMIQVLFGVAVIMILPGWRPVTGAGIFLLFIISQFLIFVRLLLKNWRYATQVLLTEQSADFKSEQVIAASEEPGSGKVPVPEPDLAPSPEQEKLL